MLRSSSRPPAIRVNSHTSLRLSGQEMLKTNEYPQGPEHIHAGTRGSHGERSSNMPVYEHPMRRSCVTSHTGASNNSAGHLTCQEAVSSYGECLSRHQILTERDDEFIRKNSKESSRKQRLGAHSEESVGVEELSRLHEPSTDFTSVKSSFKCRNQSHVKNETDRNNLCDNRFESQKYTSKCRNSHQTISENISDYAKRCASLDRHNLRQKKHNFMDEAILLPGLVKNKASEYSKVVSDSNTEQGAFHGRTRTDSDICRNRTEDVQGDFDGVKECSSTNEINHCEGITKQLAQDNPPERHMSRSKDSFRRALSSDKNLLRHDTMGNNFRLAKESGKDICVCGASAFWERERISLTTKALHLEEKSKKLRSEMGSLREARDRLHSRLLDLERLETDLKSRSEVLAARETAVEEESQRLSSLSSELKTTRAELDRYSEDLMQKDRDIEVYRRKQEKESNALREQENLINTESRRLRDLAQRLSNKKTELTETEEALERSKKQLKAIRDELHKKKVFLDARNQELLDVAYNLSEEKKRLEEQEEKLGKYEEDLEMRENQLTHKVKVLQMDREELDHIRNTLKEEREQIHEQIERMKEEKEELNQEKLHFERHQREEKEAWKSEMTQKEQELHTILRESEQKRRFCEDMELRLKVFQEELNAKEAQMATLENTLLKKEELTTVMEQNNKKRQEDLDHLAFSLKKNQHDLLVSQQELKEQQSRVAAQLSLLAKEREQVSSELQNLNNLKSTLQEKEANLKEYEKKVSQREAALLSNEARSQWHQNIMKDIHDMKDRYELQLQDFELEKRSFAEMKADVLAEQERAAVALRLREQSLASLEASIRTKHAELLRREKMLSMRCNNSNLINPPQRSAQGASILSSNTMRHDTSSRRMHHPSVSRSKSTFKSSSFLGEASSCTGSTARTSNMSNGTTECHPSQNEKKHPSAQRVRFSAHVQNGSHPSATVTGSTDNDRPPLRSSATVSCSPIADEKLKSSEDLQASSSHSSPSNRFSSDAGVALPRYPLLHHDKITNEEASIKPENSLKYSEPPLSLLKFDNSSLGLSIHTFESLVTKDQLDSMKLLDVSTASIQESPLLTMKTASS